MKYETVITSQIFLKIFTITGPLSRYMQTKGLDLLTCNAMVQTAVQQLRSIQRDMTCIQDATKKFILWANGELDLREHIDIETRFS